MHRNPDRGFMQRGAATLAVGLSLLTAITIMSLVFAHTQVTEQQITLGTLRSSEALQAADAGLAFGRSWLSRHRPEWITATQQLQISTPDSSMPLIKDGRGSPFAINIAFQRSVQNPRYILVKSDAQPRGRPGLLTTVQAYVRPQTVLSESGETAPPLVTGGCIGAVAGYPDIYPVNAHSTGTGAAIASARKGCLKPGSIDLHSGSVTERAFLPNHIWRYMFRVSKTHMQSLSDQEVAARVPARKRHYWWATKSDLSGNKWRRSLGSPEHPVVLVLPKSLGCPVLTTGSIIYGVVYIEGSCNSALRWGTSRVYGNLVIEGDLGIFNQELRPAHISHAPGSPEELKLPLIGAPMVAGTWKDF